MKNTVTLLAIATLGCLIHTSSGCASELGTPGINGAPGPAGPTGPIGGPDASVEDASPPDASVPQPLDASPGDASLDALSRDVPGQGNTPLT